MTCVEGACYATQNTPPDDFHNGWCGANTAIHNPQYFQFRAAATEVTIFIQVVQCEGGGCGLQSALLDSCDWDNSNVLSCDPGTPVGGTMVLQYSAMEVDSLYWIVIDGCGGQICEYEFEEVSGTYTVITTSVDTTVCGDMVIFDGIKYGLGVHEIPYGDTSGMFCPDSIIVLTVEPQCQAELDPIVICYPNDDTITVAPVVTGIGGAYTFLWHDGVTDSLRTLIHPVPGDTISVTVTDSEGCSSQATTVIQNIIAVSIVPDVAYTCTGNEFNDPVEVLVDGGQPPYLFEWEVEGDTFPEIPLPLPAGLYRITITDAAGCQAESTIDIIELEAPVINIFPAEPDVCPGTITGVQIIAGIESGTGPFDFEWFTSNGVFTTPIIVVTEPDSITLKVYDIFGCLTTLDFVVEELSPPEFQFGDYGPYCHDSLVAGIDIDFVFDPDIVAYQTSGWTFPLVVHEPGTYAITVTNSDGCHAVDTLVIDEIPLASADFKVNICGLSATFTHLGEGDIYLWDFGNGITDTVQNPVHVFDSLGMYSVQLIVTNACGADTSLRSVTIVSEGMPPGITDCSGVLDLGIVTSRSVACAGDPDPGFTCIMGTNASAGSSPFISDCSGVFDPVAWYSFTTDADASMLNITVKSEDFDMSAIQLFRSSDGTCDGISDPAGLTNNALTCVVGSGGLLVATGTAVSPDMTYFLSVSAVNSTGGSFELCINTVNTSQTPCVTDVDLQVVSRSHSGSLEGPFFPGEELSVCMNVNNFQVSTGEQNCQWFQGIVPVFGNGWDAGSFDSDGQPLNATMNGNPLPALNVENGGSWDWWTNVRYHHDHCYNNIGDFDANLTLDICHSLLTEDCDGSGLNGGCCGPCWGSSGPESPGSGSLLPPGWFTSGVDGSCGGLVGWPAVDWGDGNTCNGATGPWSFCFDLRIRNNPGDDMNDLTIGFFTFADGEIGSWTGGPSVCGNDLPVMMKLPLCPPVVQTADTLPAICSGQSLEFNLDVAEVAIWEWTVEAPPSVSGASSGNSICAAMISDTLTNNEPEPASVIYHFIGYSGPCPIVLHDVTVLIRPGISVDFNPSLSICTTLDSLMITAVVDGVSDDVSYLWGDGSVLPFTTLIDPQIGTSVSLTVTDLVTGCTAEAIRVIDGEGPEITVDPSEGVLCPGDPDGPDFSYVISGGNGPFMFEWTTPLDSVPVNIQPSFATLGTYGVIVTDSFQCVSESTFEVITDEPPTAIFTYEVFADSVVFTNFSQNGFGAQWDFGDGNTSVELDPVHHYDMDGTFAVTLVTYGHCTNDTLVQTIIVTSAVQAVSNFRDMKVFPNPNDGTFTILSEDNRVEDIQVFDLLGRPARYLQQSATTFQMLHPIPGVYTVVLNEGSTFVMARVIIQ